MEKLTTEGILEIIKASGVSGVSKFSLTHEGIILHIEFASKPIEQASPDAATPNPAGQNDLPNAVTFTPSRDPDLDEAKDEIEELVISDPALYEELLGQGELMDAEKAHD